MTDPAQHAAPAEASGDAGGRAVNIGLSANACLALLKTGIGIVGHSNALLADGINSISDVTYFVAVKIFMALARKPPDAEHPYGHRQLESIAALVVGSFVVTTAIAIFWEAVNNVFDTVTGATDRTHVSAIALWVALLTVVAKIGLTLYTRRAAMQSGNAAIMALARDHRNDIFSAAGAAIGILISRLGYAWGDPLVGAVVAVVVFLTGLQILRESSAELMDAVPSVALDREVRAVLREMSGLRAVEEVQAHRFGPYFVLNVTVGIDGDLTVREGDQIASQVERALASRVKLVRRVYVHYHPVRDTPGA